VFKKRWLWLPPFLLVFAIANLLRGALYFAYGPVLAEWALSIPHTLLGVIYTALGCGLAGVAVHYRRRWDLRVALGGGLVYQIALWVLALGGYRSTYARQLWGRDLVLSLLFLAAIVWLGWKAPQRKAGGPRRPDTWTKPAPTSDSPPT